MFDGLFKRRQTNFFLPISYVSNAYTYVTLITNP